MNPELKSALLTEKETIKNKMEVIQLKLEEFYYAIRPLQDEHTKLGNVYYAISDLVDRIGIQDEGVIHNL